MSEPKPVTALIHGLDGPVVILSDRVCAYLNKYAELDRFRANHRGQDAEVDNALVAMRVAELSWRSTATGTKKAATPELDPSYEWLSTTQAADRLGISGRGIRKAIAENRLQAENVAGRWRISREDLAHYKATLKR